MQDSQEQDMQSRHACTEHSSAMKYDACNMSGAVSIRAMPAAFGF